MILVSVGTNEQRFDRLLEAVAAVSWREPLVVQHALSPVRPAGAECHAYLPFDELQRLASAARRVVTHAGVGSIALALAAGRRPVVMPRLHARGEAVDDHQQPFAERLAASGLVHLVSDADELRAAVDADDGALEGFGGGATPLAAELRAFLTDVGRVRPAVTGR